MIDLIVERASSVRDLPTHTTGNRASMNAQPMEATPKSPTDVQAVIERVAHDDGHAPISTILLLGKTVLRSANQTPPEKYGNRRIRDAFWDAGGVSRRVASAHISIAQSSLVNQNCQAWALPRKEIRFSVPSSRR